MKVPFYKGKKRTRRFSKRKIWILQNFTKSCIFGAFSNFSQKLVKRFCWNFQKWLVILLGTIPENFRSGKNPVQNIQFSPWSHNGRKWPYWMIHQKFSKKSFAPNYSERFISRKYMVKIEILDLFLKIRTFTHLIVATGFQT